MFSYSNQYGGNEEVIISIIFTIVIFIFCLYYFIVSTINLANGNKEWNLWVGSIGCGLVVLSSIFIIIWNRIRDN